MIGAERTTRAESTRNPWNMLCMVPTATPSHSERRLHIRSLSSGNRLLNEHPRVEIFALLQLVLLVGDGLDLFVGGVVIHVIELDPRRVDARHAHDAVPELWDEDAVVVRVGYADHHLVVLLDLPEWQCLERQVLLFEQRHLCRGVRAHKAV